MHNCLPFLSLPKSPHCTTDMTFGPRSSGQKTNNWHRMAGSVSLDDQQCGPARARVVVWTCQSPPRAAMAYGRLCDAGVDEDQPPRDPGQLWLGYIQVSLRVRIPPSASSVMVPGTLGQASNQSLLDTCIGGPVATGMPVGRGYSLVRIRSRKACGASNGPRLLLHQFRGGDGGVGGRTRASCLPPAPISFCLGGAGHGAFGGANHLRIYTRPPYQYSEVPVIVDCGCAASIAGNANFVLCPLGDST